MRLRLALRQRVPHRASTHALALQLPQRVPFGLPLRLGERLSHAVHHRQRMLLSLGLLLCVHHQQRLLLHERVALGVALWQPNAHTLCR